MDSLPGSVLSPSAEVVKRRAPRGQVVRQHPPRAPTPKYVHDGVNHLPPRVLDRTASGFRWGQQRFQQLPLCVTEITGVGLSVHGNGLQYPPPLCIGIMCPLFRHPLSGTVVSEGASSSELVSDCNALLAVRDILAGSATLNWSVEVPITEWEGVTVHGTKQRVTALDLRNKGLTGTIPRGLDRLTNLEYLGLNGNRLTGPVPYSLVSLDKLQTLLLSGNMLTGCVPVRMQRVPNNDLDSLDLPLCDCVIGVAVPDAANNPGLVSDCTALLTARDVLAGSTILNWSPSVPIAEWEGVRLGGRPRRVKMLFLSEKLTGMLSPSLGRLSR